MALSASELESILVGDAAPAANAVVPGAASLDPAPPRTGIRLPSGPHNGAIPILFERGEVTPAFARAAPPSKEHRRGTIAVEVKLFDGPGSTHGHHDAKLLEVDLATAANLRTVDLGTDWIGSFLYDGESGPIAILWRSPIIEVLWFDGALQQRAHRSLAGVLGNPVESYLVGREVIGDRVAFAFADGETRTNVWLIDSSGSVIKRTCPARWRPEAEVIRNGDDVLVAPIGDDGFVVCAVGADGSGKVRLQPWYLASRVVGIGRLAYFSSVAFEADAGLHLQPGLYPVGSDLLPVRPAVKDPRPREVVAAVEHGLYDPATLVNGTDVLVRSPCCGNGGPYVWLWDPRSLVDGGDE